MPARELVLDLANDVAAGRVANCEVRPCARRRRSVPTGGSEDRRCPAFHMRFKHGHVLYGSRRTYLRKVAVADFEGVCANTTFVVEPSTPELLPEFLPLVMTTAAFHAHSIEQSKGSVNPYINFRDLTWFGFALPPIAGQKEILDVMNQAAALVESYSDVIDRLGVQSEALAHSIAENARGSGALTTIADLVAPDRPVTYGILKPGTGCPGGVPVIKVKDFPDGRIKESDLLLTSPEIENQFRRSRLRAGDLLISIRGTVGRVAEVPPGLEGANITQDTARLSVRSGHDRRYIRHMLGTRDVQVQIRQRITGLAVKGINIGALRQVEVPTPSLEQQRNLAAEFEMLELAAERAREALQSGHWLRSNLRESLMSGGADVQ